MISLWVLNFNVNTELCKESGYHIHANIDPGSDGRGHMVGGPLDGATTYAAFWASCK